MDVACFSPRTARLRGGPDAPKPIGFIAETDIRQTGRLAGPGGRAAAVRSAAPTAAAQDAFVAGGRAARIVACLGGVFLVAVVVIAPFGHVAVQVVQAPG